MVDQMFRDGLMKEVTLEQGPTCVQESGPSSEGRRPVYTEA